MADAIADDTTNTEDVVDTKVEDQAALESRIDENLKEDGMNVPKPKEEAKDDKADDDKTDGTDSDGDDADDSSQTDEDDTQPQDEEVGDSEEEADESAAELASNPDFSFEVEDANGKTYKITKIEDLPEDFDPKNNRQVMEIIAQANKLEGEIAAHQEKQAKDEEATILSNAQKEIQAGWQSEIQELVDEKLLDKPKLAENNPKYNDDPSVKKIDEVFKFIKDTNDARKKANNPNMLTSFRDAFDRMELRDLKVQKADESKKEGDLAKAKAGVIGTSSTSSVDVPAYRAGSYRSIDDIPL